jgi:phage baseplate assembly protein W
VNSPASATTTFSASGLANYEVRIAVYRVTATDSTGGTPLTSTSDISVEIDREF